MCVPSNDFLGFFYFPSCEKKLLLKLLDTIALVWYIITTSAHVLSSMMQWSSIHSYVMHLLFNFALNILLTFCISYHLTREVTTFVDFGDLY